MKKRIYPKTRKRLGKAGLFLAIILVCLISVFPYLWMVLVSIKDKVLVYQPGVWLFKPTFDNYKVIFQKHDLGTYMINSAIVAGCNCLISLALGCLTAYSLARHSFRNKEKFSLYYRVVVFSVPLQGHMLHCKGCCGSV